MSFGRYGNSLLRAAAVQIAIGADTEGGDLAAQEIVERDFPRGQLVLAVRAAGSYG